MRGRLLYISLILLISVASSSCLKKPTACVELDEYYEVGREYRFNSCSENFEFITWDFGDSTSGFVGEDAPHTFSQNGNPVITLTAYGNGGYRSDELKQAIKTSRRYVDRVEISGTTDFRKIFFTFNKLEFITDSVSGSFTDSAPFVYPFWPDVQVVVPLNTITVKLIGQSFTGPKSVIFEEEINFETNTENPLTFQGKNGLVVRLYWTYSI